MRCLPWMHDWAYEPSIDPGWYGRRWCQRCYLRQQNLGNDLGDAWYTLKPDRPRKPRVIRKWDESE